MKLHGQRGAISLFWAAVLVGVITVVCMAALFSMRHERNYFAEALSGIVKSDAGKAVQQAQKAAGAVAGQNGGGDIRSCTIDGKVVYSNVECDARSAGTRKVQLHDTQGFEAPKVPQPAASQVEGQPTLQDKMIEKATR